MGSPNGHPQRRLERLSWPQLQRAARHPGSTVIWSMSPLSSRQTLRSPPLAATTTRSPLKSVNVSLLPTANNP